jgi:hypothetical protein
MECPHCNNEIEGKECPLCKGITPLEGRYCMYCGSEFEDDPSGAADSSDGYDFENRVLCPDGTCTGIIIDGKCTECGKLFKKQE